MRSATIIAALAVLLGGCQDALGPDSFGREVTDGPLRVTLSLTSEVLDAPGTMTAMLTYENRGFQPITVTSSHGCLSFAGVYRGSQRIPFPATEYNCTTAISYRTLEPGAPLSVGWPLDVGGADGVALPPGTYRFVAELNTHRGTLEQTFVVR